MAKLPKTKVDPGWHPWRDRPREKRPCVRCGKFHKTKAQNRACAKEWREKQRTEIIDAGDE